MAKNKFSKALKHLKSTELDEKIQSLNESPTNSIGGVYALNQPGFRLSRELDPPKVFYPDVDGNWPAGIPGTPGEQNYVRPAGYWDEGPGTTAANPYDTLYTADWSYSVQEDNPRNTETLIDPDTGYVRSELPPNSRSFILGPLVDLYFHNHSSDNRTYVGYVQKDTREFVLLGYVKGRWGNDDDGNLIYQDGFTSGRIWNGEQSGFTASNSNFTFEMLQWFHNKLKAGKYVKNASFFNSGGVPIISGGGGTGQPSGTTQGNAVGAGTGDASNSNNANVGAGTGGAPNIGTPQDPANHGGPEDAGFPWGALNNLGDAIGDIFGAIGNFFEPLSALANAGAAFAAFLAQQQGFVNYTEDDPYQASLPPQDSQAISDALNNVMKDIPPERWENLNGNDLDKINKVLNPNSGPTPSNPDRPEDERRNTDEYHNIFNNIGKSDAFKGHVKIDQNGNPYISGINDNYVFTNDADASVAGAPALINFFANSFGAQDKMGDTPYEYTAGDAVADLDQFNKNKEKYPNDPSRWDDGADTQQVFKLKNMPIELQLPPPTGKSNVKESKEVLTESRKRILREIKQPYKMKETPKQKYKMNFKGKFTAQNTPDVTASKKSDEVVTAKNAAGQTWRTQDKYWSGYESTERMNVIYDHVGHGQIYWDTIVNENRHKKNMRDREIQEHLNLIEHKKAMKEIVEQQTLDAPKDPLFKKVAKRLKTEIDYPDKPSKNGYPDTPPPEMVNGFHPKYGKTYKYDKLDPHSAEAMPPTGNPEIDANVQKAKRLKKILGKKG